VADKGRPNPRRGPRPSTDRRAGGADRRPQRAARRSSDLLWLRPPRHAVSLTGWATLVLRGFLGFTFCFAGLQKLANPGFFNSSNPASIQQQLAGAARGSPIHALVVPLGHVAVPLGLLIALAELAVGIGTLLGLWTRLAATGGIAISVALFLTVSFHASPYYTGSDIVFVFAWTPLLVAGSAGVLSLDGLLRNRAARQIGAEADGVVPIAFSTVRTVCGAYDRGTCQIRAGAPCQPASCPVLTQSTPEHRRHREVDLDRRAIAVKGAWTAAVAVAGVVAGGLAAGVGRTASSPRSGGTSPRAGGLGRSTTSGSSSAPAASSSSVAPSPSVTEGPHPPGTAVGPAHAVPVGGAASFQDPASGDPSLVIQPVAGTFLAFDAVCPHAGCIVQYDPSGKLFVCPCHGSQFNGRTGAVESGPAPTGLTRLTVRSGSDGQLYVS
jgi:thiosulfate dehydrogenase (quinone) large subunit